MNFASYHIRRQLGFAALAVGAIVLSGCQTAPIKAPPAPTLRLLQTAPLALADTCEVDGSYFVEFIVTSDGRTDDIKASTGPVCLQQALTAWVSSFRYEAPGEQIPSGVEWMMVTGRKGS